MQSDQKEKANSLRHMHACDKKNSELEMGWNLVYDLI